MHNEEIEKLPTRKQIANTLQGVVCEVEEVAHELNTCPYGDDIGCEGCSREMHETIAVMKHAIIVMSDYLSGDV